MDPESYRPLNLSGHVMTTPPNEARRPGAQAHAAFQEQFRTEVTRTVGPCLIGLQIVLTAIIACLFFYFGQGKCTQPLQLWCVVWLIRWNISQIIWLAQEYYRDKLRELQTAQVALTDLRILALQKKERALMYLRLANIILAFGWFVLGTYWIFVLPPACDLYMLWLARVLWAVNFFEFCFGPVMLLLLVCCMPCLLAIYVCLNAIFRRRQLRMNQRLGEAIVRQLSSKQWSEIQASHTGEELEDACPICSESFVGENNQLVELPCPGRHVFHRSCILMWFRINQICPICRADVAAILGLRPPSPTEEQDLDPATVTLNLQFNHANEPRGNIVISSDSGVTSRNV
eukprot:Filipodium_phascolosomae@DN2482_c0_g1_i1.p1